MKNIFIILLLIFMLSCSKKEENVEGFLTLGTSPIFPPFSYIEHNSSEGKQNIVGFDIALATEIANSRGKKLKIKSMYFDELLPALVNGEIDIAMCAISITTERKALVDFSLTYYEASQTVLVRNDDTTFADIHTKEELGQNKRLASLLGSTGSIISHTIAKDSPVLDTKSWEFAIDELLTNEIDAIIIDRAPAKIYMSQYSGRLKNLHINFETEYYSVAVSKENRELLASVNDTISKLVNSGDYIQFVEKYIEGYQDY